MTGAVYLYLSLTGVAATAVAALAVAAWRRRRLPGALFLSLTLAAAAVWCLATIGEVTSTALAEKATWARIGYVGVVAVPWGWLLFALAYAGKTGRRLWPTAAALAVLPALTVLFVWLAPGLPLVWTSMAPSPSATPAGILVRYGPWFWIWTTYAYGAIVAGAFILLQVAWGLRRQMVVLSVAMALAAGLPLIANALSVTGAVGARGLDVTPPVMAASGALIAVAVLRLRALDVHPGLAAAAGRLAEDQLREGLLIVDADGRVIGCNAAGARLVAAGGDSPVDRRINELMEIPSGDQICCTMAALAAEERFIARATDAEGTPRVIEVTVSGLATQGEVTAYSLVIHDVTEQQILVGELAHRAAHDDLTALPNANVLREHLAACLENDTHSGGGVSLLLFGLDDLRTVNSTLGHEAGDALLVATADRLRSAVRDQDFVARLGGDEFAVVLPGCPVVDAVSTAFKLRAILLDPIDYQGQSVCVSAAVGVAVSTHHGRTPALLLRRAEIALCTAKQSLLRVAAYRSGCESATREQLMLVGELRSALESECLSLHYQPQVAVADGGLSRFEALARWRRADGRLLSSGQFIPLVEEYGLLPTFTEWAVRRALEDRRRWTARGWEVDVAVNLSARDLDDPAIVRRVAQALHDNRTDPANLWLEITETCAMVDPDQARRTLTQLRDLGVGVIIDDFGIGQSSLGYLQSLPAGEIKIDKGFLCDLTERPHNEAIVRAAVALAHELGLTVTAEGVETASVLEHLQRLGCDHAQGYHIARPMPADEVVRWLEQRSSAAISSRPSLRLVAGGARAAR